MKTTLSVEELDTRNLPSIFTSVPSSQGTLVKEWSENGALLRTINPFPGFMGELNLASGRKEHEVIIGAGAGGGPHVVRYSSTGRENSFFAYAPEFLGGVNVSAGKADGDIVTGTGRGGAPHVRIFHDGIVVKEWYAGDANQLTGVVVAGSGIGQTTFPSFSSHPDLYYTIYAEFLPGTDPNIIRRVAELYAPYKVNVTNVRPMRSVQDITHVIVGTNFAHLTGNQKGLAVVNGLFEQSEFRQIPAYVETEGLTDEEIAIAIAHEAGHSVGLEHVNDIRSIMNASLSPRSSFIGIDDIILNLRYGKF